ncbi:hypothetical protein GCM10008111_12110 [Alishewanella tabrizica]|uniref:Uncharacterized protein n=1 Tax=Alishewanella tabrizica TaxID=671278 RepID=A0ABQ2WIU1_9ALTE|nr:hypothetical protein GCM10008111_12110 [Alishewanella tabrizica]
MHDALVNEYFIKIAPFVGAFLLGAAICADCIRITLQFRGTGLEIETKLAQADKN